jgi:hypothetical protein
MRRRAVLCTLSACLTCTITGCGEDKSAAAPQAQAPAARSLVEGARADPRLAGVRNVAAPEVQTLFLDVDRNKAKSLGVPLADVYGTLGALLGSTFVNQFTAFGTNLKVRLQSEEQFRSDPAYLQRFYVRNPKGGMVPIAALARMEWRSAPIALNRYNGYPAVQLNGTSAPGRSSGEAPNANAPREDAVQAEHEESRTVVNVYHARGIGGALVQAGASGWPASMVVRLHGFPELEGFSAKAATSALVCGMTRPENRAPVQKCRLDGAEIEALRKAGGVYEITLPPSLLRAADTPVEIRWVDYWR